MERMMPQTPPSTRSFGRKREINRRQCIRYTLAASIRYRVIRDGEFVFSGTGQMIDMSANGARISLDRTVAPGMTLEVLLNWPGLYHGRDRMRLVLAGEVLRCDESGTALRIAGHEFRDVSVRVRPVSA
jgi:hypothetical protein